MLSNAVRQPEINSMLTKKSAFGKLSKYANPKLIPLEESAWESAVTEKYGKNRD